MSPGGFRLIVMTDVVGNGRMDIQSEGPPPLAQQFPAAPST